MRLPALTLLAALGPIWACTPLLPTDDGGTPPEGCEVTAPTACTDPDLRYADVEPIFEARCQVCHSAAGGEWPLDEYDHVVDWFDDIRARLLECSMPPPDSGVEMTVAEREEILLWLRCGFPE